MPSMVYRYTHLILGLVPGCVEVSWSRNVSKLNLVCSSHRVHSKWELNLEKLVILPPLYLCMQGWTHRGAKITNVQNP